MHQENEDILRRCDVLAIDMTAQQHPHATLIENLRKEFAPILNESKQGVYIYLDNVHKVCNVHFSSLLGYASPREWESNEHVFEEDIRGESQDALVSAYRRAMEDKAASNIIVTWNMRDGRSVNTNVLMVPMPYQGNLLALHFIDRIGP